MAGRESDEYTRYTTTGTSSVLLWWWCEPWIDTKACLKRRTSCRTIIGTLTRRFSFGVVHPHPLVQMFVRLSESYEITMSSNSQKVPGHGPLLQDASCHLLLQDPLPNSDPDLISTTRYRPQTPTRKSFLTAVLSFHAHTHPQGWTAWVSWPPNMDMLVI